jgi:hypothetical protein
LDAFRTLMLADADHREHGREILLRIAAMLTAMVLRLDQSGSGSRSG